ncbi:MAG TPA: DNA ligase D [Candidatus Limnocylindria bacterium]|nr:DNA ligase D [Candidatus Limnocylindria bacterium]
MPLEEYRRKRDFGATPEPAPSDVVERSGRFTVQRHRATALHYDTRLEVEGVLVSWAVPKGPTLDPGERRLAMRTEDHPIEYLDFEGVIPSGQYGAGDVIVWDWGHFEPEPETPDPTAAIRAGELKFRLHGEKLRGRFTIVRTDGRNADPDREQWLLIHKRDAHAVDGWTAEDHPASVKSGRTNDEVRDGVPPRFEAPPPAPVGAVDLSGAEEGPMPDFVPPMRATLASEPFDDPDWLFEVKWDGYRVQAVVRDGEARLWTRNRQDAAAYFPDLAGPAPWIDAREAIVDGEVVALDEEGRPRFSLLQDRTGVRSGRSAGSRRRGTPAPIVFQAFDLLHLDGRSLLGVPLEDRKRLLRSRLREHPLVRYAGHVEADGRAFFEAARQQELEGIVAKLRRAPYEPGVRSRSWLKLKARREQEAVVVGWLAGQGSHADLGSLILAVRSGDRWLHAGQVGSGLDARTRRELRERLDALARRDSPLDPVPRLKGAHWVEPRIVVRVEFAEWTGDDLLRQAAYKGVELGRDPREVRREREVATSRATAAAEAAVPEPRATHVTVAGEAADELSALEALGSEGTWTVGGRELRVTNLDKVLVPGRADGEPVTKRDLLRYQLLIAPTILPYLADRGVTVQRYPNGIEHKGFWQKDLPSHTPAWVTRWTYDHGREGRKDYPVVDHPATLAWLAQEAAIELHPWTSPTDAPDRPSYALIDIDPGDNTSWDEVLVLARLYRTALEHVGVRGHPKVTGKRGVQVWIGIRRGPTFDDTRDWVERLSRAIGSTVPDLVSWEWVKRARRGRARLDYTQNAVNKTLVAPYSPRPAPGAPVSAPITWQELDDPTLRPDRWTIRDVLDRIRDIGDPFRGVLEDEQVLPPLG